MARRDKRQTQPSTALAPVRPIVRSAADRVVVSQPSVRNQVLWTPAGIKSLALQADSGDMLRLADLCDQMMADDRIGELLDTLLGNVLACDLTFEKNSRTTLGDAEKAEELDADWPIGIDDDELKQLGCWAVMAGVGFAKIERWVENDGRIVPVLKCWHLKHFRVENIHDPVKRTWAVRDEHGNTTPLHAGDGTWVMVTRRGEFRPWANGLWRGLSPWWLSKQFANVDWNIHSEKASKWVVSQDENAMGADRSDDRRALANEIYDAAKNAVIALPIGFKMELIELSSNTEQIYKAQIDAANEAFAITILGQNLTTKVEGGSLAAAQAHADKETRKGHETAKLLAAPIQQQLLTWWAEFNFGDRSLAPYPKWHTEPPEDKLQKATALKMSADALASLKAAGYKLSSDQIEEEFGLELEELPDPPPMPAGPGAGPGGRSLPGKPAVKPAAKQAARPKPQAQAFLASGDSPDSARGFIRGQLYVDDLSDKCAARAADDLSGLVERLNAAIDGAEDYEQVRSAVLQAFRDEQDPERLVDIVQAGIVLANLAGRNAVMEDVPDEDTQTAAYGTEWVADADNDDADDADDSADSVECRDEGQTDDDHDTKEDAIEGGQDDCDQGHEDGSEADRSQAAGQGGTEGRQASDDQDGGGEEAAQAQALASPEQTALPFGKRRRARTKRTE